MSGAERKMQRRQAAKGKPVKLEVDLQKLGEALMPRLSEVLGETVKQNLPNKDAYEKAIAELNVANSKLKDMNDKLLAEISQALDEHDKRLQALEDKEQPEEKTADVPT